MGVRCSSLLLLLACGAAAFAGVRSAGRDRSRRVTMALAQGTKLDGALLTQLKVSGRRAALFLLPSDASSSEVLEVCEARAGEFRALGCVPIAIRPPDAATNDAPSTYPSLAFIDDKPSDGTMLQNGTEESRTCLWLHADELHLSH